MKTVTFSVSSIEETNRRVLEAFKGQKQGYHISFASLELFSKTMTANRWTIVQAMTGAGPMSLRELARRLDRDVHAVHDDVSALTKTGVIDKTEDGQIVFPYDEIKVNFTVEKKVA